MLIIYDISIKYKLFKTMVREIYSIDEILGAMNDLQNIKKSKPFNKDLKQKKIKQDNSNIPSNTLRLIEEAEKSQI